MGRNYHSRGRGGKKKSKSHNSSLHGSSTKPSASPATSGASQSHSNENIASSEPSPSNDALTVQLFCSPETHSSLPTVIHITGDDNIQTDDNENMHDSQSSQLHYQIKLSSWDDLVPLLTWLRDRTSKGGVPDKEAHIRFSSLLSKSDRAWIHKHTTSIGQGALVSISQGLGDERCITVAGRGSRVAQHSVIDAILEDPELSAMAMLLYKWAADADVSLSRDEAMELISRYVEMISVANKDSRNIHDTLYNNERHDEYESLIHVLPREELKVVWSQNWPRQRLSTLLCAAIAAKDIQKLESIIEENLDMIKASKTYGLIDQRTGVSPLHLAAGEGFVPGLEALLSAGYPVDAPDGDGVTALSISRKYEQSDAEGVLLRAGAADASDQNSNLLFSSQAILNDVNDSVVSVCGTEEHPPTDVGSVSPHEYEDVEYSSPVCYASLSSAAYAGKMTEKEEKEGTEEVEEENKNVNESIQQQIHQWAKHHAMYLLVGTGVVAVGAVAIGTMFLWRHNSSPIPKRKMSMMTIMSNR